MDAASAIGKEAAKSKDVTVSIPGSLLSDFFENILNIHISISSGRKGATTVDVESSSQDDNHLSTTTSDTRRYWKVKKLDPSLAAYDISSSRRQAAINSK